MVFKEDSVKAQLEKQESNALIIDFSDPDRKSKYRRTSNRDSVFSVSPMCFPTLFYSKMDDETNQASHDNILTNHQTDEPKPTIETENVYINPEGIDQVEPEVVCHVPEKTRGNEISQDISNETVVLPHVKRPETAEVEKVDALDYHAIETNNVFLNCSCSWFSLWILLWMQILTAHYQNWTLNRQTLIVVPRYQTNTNYLERSLHSSTDLSYSSESNKGYWESVKRTFSYVNPFSYLSGGGASQSPCENSLVAHGNTAFNQLCGHFDAYRDVPKITKLWEKFKSIKQILKSRVFSDFSRCCI